MFGSKKNIDERIQKKSEEIFAPLYPLIIVLTLVIICLKLYMGLPLELFVLEFLVIVISITYLIIMSFKLGINPLTYQDEHINELKFTILSKSFMICFWIYIIGEVIYLFVFPDYFNYIFLCFIAWVIPSLIGTYRAIKCGVMTFGSGNNRKITKKKFGFNTIVGALFYSVFMNWDKIVEKGLSVSTLISILLMALMWGIPFYLCMKLLIFFSEKKTDEEVGEDESDDYEK